MADQFNILDYTEGPLLKTGETTDFTPAGRTTKADGGFQLGIAGSKEDGQYIILTTGQYTGNSTITINSINDPHSNECVFDKVTGLMWNRTNSAQIYGTGAQGLLWDDSASNPNAEDIFAYCDAANAASLSGFTDWRVPNELEVLSLSRIVNANNDAPPNQVAFPTVGNNNYWSSTTAANATTVALRASFANSSVGTANKLTIRERVMLVRLGGA